MHTEAQGTGHKLASQIWAAATGFEHGLGFGEVERHAGLAQNVLAVRERGERHRRMQIWPSADDDGIDRRIGDEILPMLERSPNAELAGGGGSRFGPAVANSDDLDIAASPQAGYVPQARVGAQTDDADS